MQRPGMESWTCMVERPTMRTGSSQDAPTQEAALPKKGIAPMRPRMTRFLRISDTLVLVAATGLGLAGCQVWLSAEHLVWSDLWPRDSHSVLASLWIAALAVANSPPGAVALLDLVGSPASAPDPSSSSAAPMVPAGILGVCRGGLRIRVESRRFRSPLRRGNRKGGPRQPFSFELQGRALGTHREAVRS